MEVISEVDTNTETASLGNVQLAQVNITNITVCQGVSNRAIPSNMLSPYAFDVQISGTLSKPLQQSWSGLWGLWHGPHAIQSWPLAGGVAAIPVGLNNFTVAGLRGQWSQPKSNMSKSTDLIVMRGPSIRPRRLHLCQTNPSGLA